jgi:DNA-binding Lrp family transcriptional regulator
MAPGLARAVDGVEPARTGRGRKDSMVNAVVLLKVQRERLNEVAKSMSELEGVSEVYYVAGQWDLVAMLRARDDDEFAAIVTEGMLRIDGIKASETLIAFQVLSRFDLNGIFSAS